MSSPILIYGGGSPPAVSISNPPVYSQAGTTPLVEGQAYIDVVFGSIQTTENWGLVTCEVENTIDFEPLNIWPGIITNRTTAGFRLQLNGLPDTGNYYLHWAVSGINIVPVSATTYFLTGPTSGANGVAATFTVALPPNTTLVAPVLITPDDGGGGGAFAPVFVTLSTGTPSVTFTYTPASYGVRTINVTNTGPLSNPAGIAFDVVVTTYTLSGPGSGSVGVASTNFTVALPVGAVVTGTITVTMHDAGDGGTFTPTTVGLTTGAPSATFTYTPASVGAKTVSVTNDGGLTNPGNLTYTASVTPHLLNTLISYWKLDEASGTRNDSNGTNHLTLGTLPAGATGKINNGALFVKASSQYAGVASNSTVQVTGSFTISLWIKFTSQVLTVALSKWGTSGMEYGFIYDPATGIQFAVASVVTADVALGPTIANGVWAHLVGWFDSGTGLTHIRLNDATTYNGTVPTATATGPAQFIIGGTDAIGGGFYVDALIDEVGFWKRILTAQEITALYNGGAGLAYSSFTA